MGQLNGSTGNANTPNVIENKYLNLEGLTSFWAKAKQYVISSQETQTTDITNAYTKADNTIRSFIGQMTINGHSLATYTPDEKDENVAGTLTHGENLIINSSEIPLTDAAKEALSAGTVVDVEGNGDEYVAATNVDEGLIQLDTRLDAVENAFDSGVVTNVTVVDTPSGEESLDDDKDLITFTSNEAAGTGDIVLTLDHTKLNQRIKAIDALDEEFANYTVNGKSLFAKSSGEGVSPVTGTATAVVLTGGDINRNNTTNSKTIAQTFTDLENKIGALVSATVFKGVVTWDPTEVTVRQVGTDLNNIPIYRIWNDKNVIVANDMQSGDIVIYGYKEYILDGTHKNEQGAVYPIFVELGDVTAVQAQLTEIQNWINAPITEAEILGVFEEK